MDNPNAPNQILVTGGAGFIGSHLCKRLLTQFPEASIICFDNLSNGWPGNIEDITDNPNFQFEAGDITNIKSLKRLVTDSDWVFHQAAVGSVPRSFETPLLTHDTNSTGFLNLIECIRSSKVSKLVYASSSSVYGDSTTLPKVESQLGKTLSPYAVTKLNNEEYARTLLAGRQVQHVGLRYFNVFGPNQNPKGPYAAVIPRFIDAVLKGGKMRIYGDGWQSRDFTYVDNVVNANINAAVTPLSLGAPYVLNIGCGEKISVLDLAQRIEKSLATRDLIENVEPRPGDIRDSLADISLARQTINYSPTVSVLEGLDKTIVWYLNNQNFFG